MGEAEVIEASCAAQTFGADTSWIVALVVLDEASPGGPNLF